LREAESPTPTVPRLVAELRRLVGTTTDATTGDAIRSLLGNLA
jgi:hypothetical protein